MKKNMGSADKVIRVIIAAIIGILNYVGVLSGTVGIITLALAVVFALTSFLNFCPLYVPFGIRTCKNKEE